MAYGVSADRKLVKQFVKMCELSACEENTRMTQKASRNIVKFFWQSDPVLKHFQLKSCETKVFARLTNKKKYYMLVDGPHVEAYITEMAHEITKVKKDNPKISRSDGNVTICKNLLEKQVRETIVLITGTIDEADDSNYRKAGNKSNMDTQVKSNKEARATRRPNAVKRPEFHKDIRMFDFRKRMPIVIAKRDYGNN